MQLHEKNIHHPLEHLDDKNLLISYYNISNIINNDNHIIFRLLSKEDVEALNTYNGGIETREYIDIHYKKLNSPFNEK